MVKNLAVPFLDNFYISFWFIFMQNKYIVPFSPFILFDLFYINLLIKTTMIQIVHFQLRWFW